MPSSALGSTPTTSAAGTGFFSSATSFMKGNVRTSLIELLSVRNMTLSLSVASTRGGILMIVQSVNTHTPTTGRWQPVLQRLAEGLVDQLCLWKVSHSRNLTFEALLTSSSPCAFWFACSSNRIRWSNGSFNSVYALQISFLQTKASKRSHRPGCVGLAR
jgi:hypothetical protein